MLSLLIGTTESDLEFLNTLQIILCIIGIVCGILVPFGLWKAWNAYKEYKIIKAHNEKVDNEYWKRKRRN